MAAERLPSSGADDPAVTESAIPSSLPATAGDEPSTTPPGTVPAPPATGRPTGPTVESAVAQPTADTGTIVAHATVRSVVAHQRPSADSPVVADFAHPTDRGGPLVFQGLGQPVDGWLEVLLPIRPNNSRGWIRTADVELTRNPYRIEIDLDRYRISVEREGRNILTAPIAIGKGGTPTPIGDFYLIELLRPPEPDGPYGTYAYGLSGYSDVLDEFNGGDGVIGIHGTNEPELLGGPASHGCIRLHNDTITELAGFLPLGTPVSIRSEPADVDVS